LETVTVHANGVQNQTRYDFEQFYLLILALEFLRNLIISEPDSVVSIGKLINMVYKRLRFRMVLWHVESRNKRFFNDFQMCLAVKFSIEGQ